MAGALPARAANIPAPQWQAYRQAMVDSERPQQSEVVNDLVRLTRTDPRVRWKVIDGQRHVLVATLRRNALSETSPFTLANSTWVTVPRELRKRCAPVGCDAKSDARLDLTLKQFLGLPPDSDHHVVMTFWARPRDMFRPCRQPDVRSSTCPRRAPGPLPVLSGISMSDFLKEQAAYAWRMPRRFDAAAAVSCSSAWPEPSNCYGFPWTRLGYTYDWGPGRNEIGLTEFVIAKGSTVHLSKIWTQREFVSRERSTG